MKMIQISDLHIDNDFNNSDYCDMLKKMIDCINIETRGEDHIYLVCCGDIVNKGKPDEYLGKASKVFDYIKNNITDKKTEFLFVPGNHDLCHDSFKAFQKFIEKYNDKINFVSENVALYEGHELDFVLVNSCYHKEYTYGNIDIEALNKLVVNMRKPALIIMHHTLLSRYSDDRSAISNAYKFLDIVENNHIIGILHGHTHGYSNILIGQNCRVVGVGSLFAYIRNCNNQFNLLEIRLDKVERIVNYRYNFDLEGFSKVILFENSKRNFFANDKVSLMYKEVRDTVKACGGINNLYINIKTNVDNYKHDMEDNFIEDIKRAELWLEEETPSTLYYNHGQYMVDSRYKGINYIIDELERNSTSNRAIIPLVRFSDVLDKQFGHLPGLNSIQFGFLNDEKAELYCSVYLRSLEVNHFLKINLSEIYLLLLKICDEIRSIKRIVITIYAFKAQYKEKFSCFRKAQIDVLNVGSLSKFVYQKDTEKIVNLLKDKFGMEETVINTNGLMNFYDILKESELYDEQLIVGIKEIIDEMDNLKQEYMKSSNYEEIKPIEERIHRKQQKYLELILNI